VVVIHVRRPVDLIRTDGAPAILAFQHLIELGQREPEPTLQVVTLSSLI